MSSWEREEARAARLADEHRPHPPGCRCRGCARDEADRGSSAVEYALVLAAMVAAVLSYAVAIGGPLREAYDCALRSAATAGIPVYCGPTPEPAEDPNEVDAT